MFRNGNSENKNMTLMLLAVSGVMTSRSLYRYLFSDPQVSREVKSSTVVTLRGRSPSLFGLATGGATAALSMARHIPENRYNRRQSVGNEIICKNDLTTVTPRLLPDEGYMYRVRFCHTSTSHALAVIPATLGYVAGIQHCGVLIEGFQINLDGTIRDDKPTIIAVYGYNNSTSKGQREIIKNRMVQDLKDITGRDETDSTFQEILKDQLQHAAGIKMEDAGNLRGLPGTGFMNEACADFLGTDDFLALKEDVLKVESLMPLSAVQAGFNEAVSYCATATLNHAHTNCGTSAMYCVHKIYGVVELNSEQQKLYKKQENFAKGVNQGIGVTRNKTLERAVSLPPAKPHR